MRFTFEQAVEELAAIPFFPGEVGAITAIMRQLQRFVDTPEHLRWLVDTAVAKMPRWQGIPELRGLYCTRFKPKDGIEADSTLPGFTPADSETGYLEIASHHKALEMADGEDAKRIAALAKRKMLQ